MRLSSPEKSPFPDLALHHVNGLPEQLTNACILRSVVYKPGRNHLAVNPGPRVLADQ